MTSKILLAVVGVLLVVGGGILYFVLQERRSMQDMVEFRANDDAVFSAKGEEKEDTPDSSTDVGNREVYEVQECGITFEYNPDWEVRRVSGSAADNILIVIDRPDPITSAGIVNINISHNIQTVAETVEKQRSKGCNGCEFREPLKSNVNGIEVTELYVYDIWNEQDIRPGHFYFKEGENVCALNDEAASTELIAVLESLKPLED